MGIYVALSENRIPRVPHFTSCSHLNGHWEVYLIFIHKSGYCISWMKRPGGKPHAQGI